MEEGAVSGFPVRPVRGYVYLLDDQPETVEGGIVVRRALGAAYLDYVVVAGSGDGFGPGDRVLLDDANAGRRVFIDGVTYRLVEAGRVMAREE